MAKKRRGGRKKKKVHPLKGKPAKRYYMDIVGVSVKKDVVKVKLPDGTIRRYKINRFGHAVGYPRPYHKSKKKKGSQ